jgi:hypothetical protein
MITVQSNLIRPKMTRPARRGVCFYIYNYFNVKLFYNVLYVVGLKISPFTFIKWIS